MKSPFWQYWCPLALTVNKQQKPGLGVKLAFDAYKNDAPNPRSGLTRQFWNLLASVEPDADRVGKSVSWLIFSDAMWEYDKEPHATTNGREPHHSGFWNSYCRCVCVCVKTPRNRVKWFLT